MDLAITEQVEATASKTGSTTAPAHTLYDIVRKLPDGAQVELESASDGNSLTIRAGRSRFTLQCLPPADFPAMAEGDLPHRFQLPATDLKGIIDRTRFAISTEETRYYLNGIYFHAATRTAPRCCAAWPPTAIAWPGWRCRCPRAPRRSRA